jgi:CheY-like chemotaxis protein
MAELPSQRSPADEVSPPRVASELNNLLQIIGGTTDLLENIWQGAEGSERYIAMLRFSVDRAARVTAQLVEQAGGANNRVLLHPSMMLPPPLQEGPTAEAAPMNDERQRVMLIDDEPMTLLLFQKALQEEGYEVVLAESGFKALDILTREGTTVDLVVLDYTMPFMNGEETFRRIRTIAPEVPVTLAAGFIHQEILDSMLAGGLSGYVRKPLPPQELAAHVTGLLGPKRDQLEASPASGIAAAI